MFETIASGVYFIGTIVYYGLYCSFKTGQFLVTTVSLLLQNTFICIDNLFEILIIILEAFTIFFQDVIQCLQQFCRTISYLLELVLNGISTTLCDINRGFESLVFTIVTVYNFIVNSVFSVGVVIGQFFILLKRLIVLFGSGVWFSVTLIPLFIIYLGTLCTYYLGRLLEEIIDSVSTTELAVRNILKSLYEFLTDIPAESVAGIVVAICLAYIVTQFYIIVYLYMCEQFRNVFQHIYRKYNSLRRQPTNVIQRTTSRVRMLPRRRPQIRTELCVPEHPKIESMVDERYCVICQERIKCILVLPCRHVCMCNECSVRLQLYNNTCPICRNDIESTMKIFV